MAFGVHPLREAALDDLREALQVLIAEVGIPDELTLNHDRGGVARPSMNKGQRHRLRDGDVVEFRFNVWAACHDRPPPRAASALASRLTPS